MLPLRPKTRSAKGAHQIQSPRRIAVIGGGWAGCAAAVALTDAGVQVDLYEQARDLGGRARRVMIDGMKLDNGQHLLLGAYHATLAAIERLHGRDATRTLFHRMPLTMQPFGGGWAGDARIKAARLPAPFHLLTAVLCARGLPWSERLALVRDVKRATRTSDAVPDGTTVADFFERTPRRVFQGVWEPLCFAAMNTPPARASARVFANVLRAAFTGPAGGSDFLIPAADLTALLPQPAGRVVERGGGHVYTGQRVCAIDRDMHGVHVVTPSSRIRYDGAIVAVGPHQVAAIDVIGAAWAHLRRQLATLSFESITTVYMGFAHGPKLTPLARLDDAPGHWVFDRGSVVINTESVHLLAVVISAGGPHDAMDHMALIGGVAQQLQRLAPTLGEHRFARVIAERRATYACVPDLDRPAAGHVADGIVLCGDYTDLDFPATLEAAVRSGNAAAKAIIAGA